MANSAEYTPPVIEPSEAKAMASLLASPIPSAPALTLSAFETFVNQLERVYHSTDNVNLGYYPGSINADRRGNPYNTFILNRELNILVIGVSTNSPLFVKPKDNDSVVVFSLNETVNGAVISRKNLDEYFDKLVARLSDSKDPSAVLFAQILTEYKTLAGA
jgi:hypothetical protein